MAETSPVIFAMCGLGLVCLGLFGIGMFMLIRATGNSFIAPIFAMFQQGADRHVDEDPLPLRGQRADANQSFQAKAQSLDFDSAVNRYRQQTTPPPATPIYPAQSVPPAYPPQNTSFTAQSAPQNTQAFPPQQPYVAPPQNTSNTRAFPLKPPSFAQNTQAQPPQNAPQNTQMYPPQQPYITQGMTPPPQQPQQPSQNTQAFPPQQPYISQTPPQNPSFKSPPPAQQNTQAFPPQPSFPPQTPAMRPPAAQPPSAPRVNPPPPVFGNPQSPSLLGPTAPPPPLRGNRPGRSDDEDMDMDDDIFGL